jgi:hypothetical protein
LAGILTDKFGIRKTAFVGGLIATIGMLLSSFFVDRVSESAYLCQSSLVKWKLAIRSNRIIAWTTNYKTNEFIIKNLNTGWRCSFKRVWRIRISRTIFCFKFLQPK